MPAPLNIELDGDGASCHVYAQWLRGLVKGTDSISTGMGRVRSESESAWQSEAGQKLRDLLTRNNGDADQLEEFFNREAIAVEALAKQLDTVRARLDRARDLAQSGGLTVTATTIEPPPQQGTPDVLPDGPPSPDLQHKFGVWKEVIQTVHDARGIETKAHDDLASALQMHKNFLQNLAPHGWAWVSSAQGLYTGAHAKAKTLQKLSQQSRGNAKAAYERFNSAQPNTAERNGAMRDYIKNQGAANRTGRVSSGLSNFDEKIPGASGLKGALGYGVKGMGVLSAGVTLHQAHEASSKGVPADKAYTKAGATIAATAGVNIAADAAIGATVATTAGAVVATGGTVLIGAAVAAGVGWAVDNYYDDAKNWVESWF